MYLANPMSSTINKMILGRCWVVSEDIFSFACVEIPVKEARAKDTSSFFIHIGWFYKLFFDYNFLGGIYGNTSQFLLCWNFLSILLVYLYIVRSAPTDSLLKR
mgnify:CR=1 FL=1